MNKILQGDCIDILKTLPSESVDCIITSPPYWGLRDYGVSGQLGLEANPDLFIEPMVLAGCPVGGICLDPFMGAGTTAVVAVKNRRNYIGIELNPEYIKIAEKRLKTVQMRLL